MSLFRLAFLVLIVQTLAAQQTSPAPVQGTVVRANTTEPLSKTKVELRTATGAANSIVATSDENGRFTFSKVEPGQYRLLASRAGYIFAEYGQAFAGGPALTLTVSAGQRLQDIRMNMTQGGVITGRVLDRGKPVGNARVFAVKASYELGQRVTSTVLSAVTNDLGEYHIFWLPPGRYYILGEVYDDTGEVAPVATSTGDSNPLLQMGPTNRFVFTRAISSVLSDTEMHVPMFYPGTPELREALPIDVAPGSLTRGIDIKADTVPALHVRGTVSGMPLNTNGQPTRAGVILHPIDSGSTMEPTSVQAESNGSFDLRRVKPGSYVLTSAGGTFRARVPIEVGDHDINGVRVELRPGVGISGRVIVDGQAASNLTPIFPALRIALLSDPVLGGFRQSAAAAIPAGSVTPSADGLFTIPDSVTTGGQYRVLVVPLLNPAAGWTSTQALPPNLTPVAIPPALQNAYVKSIRLGDTDVLQDGLRLTGNREPLLIVIGTNAGAVNGRVLNAQGQIASASTVVLMPEDNLRFRVAHKYSFTDAEGRFQIQGIAPGDYKLFAWEQIQKGDWQDPEFMRNHEASGKPVHIEEGGKITVDVTSIAR